MPEKTSIKKTYIYIAVGTCLLIIIGIFLFNSNKYNKSDTSISYNNSDEDNEIDLSSVHSAELENIKMASAEVSLADGSEISVELIMTSGKYYDECSEDYIPSILTYDRNYEGTYELRTVNEKDDILFQINLADLWSDIGSNFNFPGEFKLEWADYNSDGCPDFSIGFPFTSSNMGFQLFTVREDGSLENLSNEEILLNSYEKFSVIFEHDSDVYGMPITGYVYDNSICEVESIVYYYNENTGLYEER